MIEEMIKTGYILIFIGVMLIIYTSFLARKNDFWKDIQELSRIEKSGYVNEYSAKKKTNIYREREITGTVEKRVRSVSKRSAEVLEEIEKDVPIRDTNYEEDIVKPMLEKRKNMKEMQNLPKNASFTEEKPLHEDSFVNAVKPAENANLYKVVVCEEQSEAKEKKKKAKKKTKAAKTKGKKKAHGKETEKLSYFDNPLINRDVKIKPPMSNKALEEVQGNIERGNDIERVAEDILSNMKTGILDCSYTGILNTSTGILGKSTEVLESNTEVLDSSTGILDNSTEILDNSTGVLQENEGTGILEESESLKVKEESTGILDEGTGILEERFSDENMTGLLDLDERLKELNELIKY